MDAYPNFFTTDDKFCEKNNCIACVLGGIHIAGVTFHQKSKQIILNIYGFVRKKYCRKISSPMMRDVLEHEWLHIVTYEVMAREVLKKYAERLHMQDFNFAMKYINQQLKKEVYNLVMTNIDNKSYDQLMIQSDDNDQEHYKNLILSRLQALEEYGSHSVTIQCR